MTQQRSNPSGTDKANGPVQQASPPDAQRDSFDPSGPYGGFGGAGGTQGSVYSDSEVHADGPSEQRREHDAWQRDPSKDPHGGVIAGEKGPYGDYGEIQEHHGGYWYGGGDKGGKGGKPAAPPAASIKPK